MGSRKFGMSFVHTDYPLLVHPRFHHSDQGNLSELPFTASQDSACSLHAENEVEHVSVQCLIRSVPHQCFEFVIEENLID